MRLFLLMGWRSHYAEEAGLDGQAFFDLDDFGHDGEYWHLIDDDTFKDVRGIGDVDNLKSKVPVQFPLAEGQSAETEGFNWFVNNTGSTKAHVGVALGSVKNGKVLVLRRNKKPQKLPPKNWNRR